MNPDQSERKAPGGDRDAQATDRLLHIADLHFWEVTWNPFRLLSKRFIGNFNVAMRRRREFPMERAEAHLETVKETGVSTALLTGDFTSTATEREFERARRFVDTLAQQGLSIHALPGNHDVYTFGSHRRKRFERHFREYVPEGGYPARTTLPNGTPLILVPTVCPNLLSSRGRVTTETVDIVARHLADYAANQPSDVCRVIVAGHYPVLSETNAYSSSWGRRLAGAAELRQAMGVSGVQVLYVCGHVHRFSFVRDPLYPNLHHVSTGAFFRLNHREQVTGEFAEIHAGPRGFDVYRHTCTETWSRRAIPL